MKRYQSETTTKGEKFGKIYGKFRSVSRGDVSDSSDAHASNNELIYEDSEEESLLKDVSIIKEASKIFFQQVKTKYMYIL